MTWPSIQEKARLYAPWAAVALGISLPLSTAFDSVLLALVILLWLVGAAFGDKFRAIVKNPVAVASLLLALLCGAGLFWGTPDRDAFSDAKTFLLIPLLIPLFREPRFRRYGLWAFLGAMFFVLVFSCLIFFGQLPPGGFWKGVPESPYVTHHYITQNVLMAFAAFAWAAYARLPGNLLVRAGGAVLALAAMGNILFMVPGKTGHVILAVLILYYFFHWLGWRKGGAAALAVLVVLFGLAFALPQSAFHQRTTQAVREFQEWGPGQKSTEVVNVVGYRMEFWKNSWGLFLEKPWKGWGTGSFPRVYAEKYRGTGMILTDNPHNQYLLTSVELGIAGALLLLALFAVQWVTAASLSGPLHPLLARGLVLTMATGSLFNSLLSDHTEALFFVFVSALLFAGYERGRP